MNKIEAVIFDMDGVLIDTERISFESFKEVFKDYDYDINEEFYVTMIGRNAQGLEIYMKEKYGKDFPFQDIYEKKVKLSRSIIDRDGVIIKPGVHELIDYLRENNFKIAVATSTRRERAIKSLEEIEIKDKVDYIICGDQVKNSKPDPEIFIKAAEGLNIAPENCIVIEDSEAGIRAACNSNIRAINVPDMRKPDNIIRELSFKICDNLMDVKRYLKSIN